MTNPEFTLADLLRTAQHLDDLDDQIILIDDPVEPGPAEDVPFGDVPIEDDPIIHLDDPIEPEPADEVPFGDIPIEDDPIIRIDDPAPSGPPEVIDFGNWEDGETEDAGPAQPEGIKAWDDPNYNPPGVYTLTGPGEGEVHDEPVEDAPAEDVVIESEPTPEPVEADDFSVA